jgi:hypothetical protein
MGGNPLRDTTHGICRRCLEVEKQLIKRRASARQALSVALAIGTWSLPAHADDWAFDRLADAIKVAEGCNPHYWYGVHHAGQTPLAEPEARRRCLHILRREWLRCPAHTDFIHFLAPTYCGGDWKQWERNVREIMYKQGKERK